jgi:hypothetical protein
MIQRILNASIAVKLRKIIGWYEMPPGYKLQRNKVGQWRWVDIYAPDIADMRYGDPCRSKRSAVADAWFFYDIGVRVTAEDDWGGTP